MSTVTTPMQPESEPEEIKHVLDLARGALDQQFQVAERLDAKSRGQMTLAGAWFTVVQAVAGAALGLQDIGHGWALAILVAAAASAIALVTAIALSYGVWKLRPEREFEGKAIRDFADWAFESGTLSATLPDYYAELLDERLRENADRVTAFKRSMIAWAVALALPLAELLIALAARLTQVA